MGGRGVPLSLGLHRKMGLLICLMGRMGLRSQIMGGIELPIRFILSSRLELDFRIQMLSIQNHTMMMKSQQETTLKLLKNFMKNSPNSNPTHSGLQENPMQEFTFPTLPMKFSPRIKQASTSKGSWWATDALIGHLTRT